jgi:hypothetical protein
MNLSGLPQFTVEEIQPTTNAVETNVIGRLSHLRGIRSTRGFLYRSSGPSIVGDLAVVPRSIEERVEFNVFTSDLALAPDLRIGAEFPWLDGYWQPRHLSMILAVSERWERRRFVPSPARYFRVDGVRGWQADSEPLPAGATDLGVRADGWDHEHCELCEARISTDENPEGYVDPENYWLCLDCFDKYASLNDISFAAEA